jgi:hypothetical protein
MSQRHNRCALCGERQSADVHHAPEYRPLWKRLLWPRFDGRQYHAFKALGTLDPVMRARRQIRELRNHTK